MLITRAVKVVATAVGLLASVMMVQAETIVDWQLFGQQGNEVSVAPNSSATGVTGHSMSRGPGLTAVARLDSFSAAGWEGPGETGPTPAERTDYVLNSDEYIGFGFTVDAGSVVTLDTLRLTFTGTATGPANLMVVYLGDGTITPQVFGILGVTPNFAYSQEMPVGGVVDYLITYQPLPTEFTGVNEFRILELGNNNASGTGDTTEDGAFRLFDWYEFPGPIRHTVEFTGSVTIAPLPALDIEKMTNGKQADGAHDSDVPRIAQDEIVAWTYEVTNTGEVAVSEGEVTVTDSQPGIAPVLDPGSDVGGDSILSPGETWTYTASALALDLTLPPVGITVVPGCNDNRNTYENVGRVDLAETTVFDEDTSHYCNMGDVDGDGVTDREDNCYLKPNGPLSPDAGGNSQRDTDEDNYGNVCDGDLDNSGGVVNFGDLAAFKTTFGTTDPDADFDGSGGVVNFGDLATFKQLFGQPPGPSCCAP